jgi:hypothetical protein
VTFLRRPQPRSMRFFRHKLVASNHVAFCCFECRVSRYDASIATNVFVRRAMGGPLSRRDTLTARAGSSVAPIALRRLEPSTNEVEPKTRGGRARAG